MINQPKFSCSNFLGQVLVFAIISLGQICIAQNTFLDQESLMMLENDTIKREIASFSIKGLSVIKSDSLYKPSLIELSSRAYLVYIILNKFK